MLCSRTLFRKLLEHLHLLDLLAGWAVEERKEHGLITSWSSVSQNNKEKCNDSYMQAIVFPTTHLLSSKKKSKYLEHRGETGRPRIQSQRTSCCGSRSFRVSLSVCLQFELLMLWCSRQSCFIEEGPLWAPLYNVMQPFHFPLWVSLSLPLPFSFTKPVSKNCAFLSNSDVNIFCLHNDSLYNVTYNLPTKQRLCLKPLAHKSVNHWD